jgi:hypothetical protein
MRLATISLLPTIVSVSVALLAIHGHFLNYRKPQQQRLIVRILLIVPIYSLVCYLSLLRAALQPWIEPLREIYEAFVIYTFFTLLTDYLDGERHIVVMTSGRAPVSHPWPLSLVLKPIDISDPFELLWIKRGILQYVWLKPFICASMMIAELNDWSSMTVWVNVGYNCSASLSLFQLGMFWKCLYRDLKRFNPMGKFLCVKLIIFASYWQGMMIAILRYFNWFVTSGGAIQSFAMSIELVGFAIGHYYSFSYTEYIPAVLSGCGRLPYWYAFQDPFGTSDLIHDFKKVWLGDGYDYRKFDSVEAMIAHPESRSRMKRFNQGFRVSKERGKYWLRSRQMENSIKQQHVDQHTPLLLAVKPESITSHSSMVPNYPKSVISYNSSMFPSALAEPYNDDGFREDQQETHEQEQGREENEEEDDEEEEEVDNLLAQEYVADLSVFEQAKRERPFGDLNSPVLFEGEEHSHSRSMERRRREVWARQERSRAERSIA